MSSRTPGGYPFRRHHGGSPAITADRFSSFTAIDWSGASGRHHAGIAVASCPTGGAAPMLITPPGRLWSREAVLGWLVARREEAMLVGFDFSFSAPFSRGAHLPGETMTDSAAGLWAHVDAHSTDEDLGAAGFVADRRGRHFYLGAADGRKADFLHWRVCETGADGAAKPSTVFDAIGAAQVSKASFAGMRLLHRLNGRVPIWPFDPLAAHGMTVVEIYTAIAARAAGLPKGRSKVRTPEALDAALDRLGSAPHRAMTRYDDHSTDAILASAWLRKVADRDELWHPRRLTAAIARTEGWTFGVA